MRAAKQGYIHLNMGLKQALKDFQWIFCKIANKPINIEQITLVMPNIHGYMDACKYAMRDIWILQLQDGSLRCIFWTYDFPPKL